MTKEYSLAQVITAIVGVFAFITILSIFSLSYFNQELVIEEDYVHVIGVPNAGRAEVIYNDERYDVILPIDHYTEEMNRFAHSLLNNGGIYLRNFTISKDKHELYPSEVTIDGENVVQLLLDTDNY
ncbi:MULTISPECIES: hypothetical protein [Metabacillus]|uniref:hypothetical protein n=1 Tax=Metabacillus TaxID=2675233 RepID=UPI000C809205|nr:MULTISPECIES: hypothetical protein [Metabacillus]MCM3443373.1 hypothetical protein [Metabacillus halosaccharovorans]PMC34936.1 hypothetical protein CJ195_20720 [Bacillus sp. UMB0899]